MNTGELIALAAKAAIAAGIKLEPYLDQGDASPRWVCSDRGITSRWDPLTSDGDAFRLAVVLGLNVFHAANSCYAMPAESDLSEEQVVRYCDAADVYEATRLAIVRVAAALQNG